MVRAIGGVRSFFIGPDKTTLAPTIRHLPPKQLPVSAPSVRLVVTWAVQIGGMLPFRKGRQNQAVRVAHVVLRASRRSINQPAINADPSTAA
jgi:hypothetical protein